MHSSKSKSKRKIINHVGSNKYTFKDFGLNELQENQTCFKSSTLFSLSKVFRIWTKKELILNLINNTLLIRSKGKEMLLYLKSFSVKNLGKFRKKWCFSLEGLISNKKKHQKFIIGCEDQSALTEWISLFSEMDKKKKPSMTSEMGELTVSMHNIGVELAKYDNFLDRDDILSPSKVLVNPENKIIERLPNGLENLFYEVKDLIENKEIIENMNQDENWNECFYQEGFKILMNKNDKNWMKFVMIIKGKTAEEIFAELIENENYKNWNEGLIHIDCVKLNNSKTYHIEETYKNNEENENPFSLEYTRFHNKLKNYFFIIGKTYNSLKNIKINKYISILFTQKSGNSFFYHENQIETNFEPNNFLYNKMKAYLNFYKYCLLLDKNVAINNELAEESKNFSFSFVEKKEFSILIDSKNNKNNELKKNSFKKVKIQPFEKGNADNYPDQKNLQLFLSYYLSNNNIKDCIESYHNKKIIENRLQTIETNDKNGHFAFKRDYTRAEKGGLQYLNNELMVEQKKVILSLLKQAGSAIIHGRSLNNVSLPIEVFEPRSFLERLARSFGHAPIFLEEAANTSNIIEQMKLTLAFFLSSMVLCIQQEKPFNPILGETFQGRINGCPIYLEQIKHHPPVTFYNLIGRGYELVGSHEPLANLTPNTLIAEQKGCPYVQFKNNGTKIYFKWPLFVINGTALGQRSLNFFSKAFIFEKTNSLFCEVIFNANEIGGFKGLFTRKDYKIDEIAGGIYKVKPELLEKFENSKKSFKFNLDHDKEILETISVLKGEWTSFVEFDEKRYWDIEKHKPFLLEYEDNPLPSDCNYREDVIYLRMGNKSEAQIKKNEGEQKQRLDKKLRENFGKKKKK